MTTLDLSIIEFIDQLPRFYLLCSVLAFYVVSTWRRHVAFVFLD